MNVVYQIKIGPWKQIGSTSKYKVRMREHRNSLIKGMHWNKILQNAWNKYSNFESEILSEWSTREEAYFEEQKLLDLYYKKENYAMISPKAYGTLSGENHPSYGIKRPQHSEFMKEYRLNHPNPMENKKGENHHKYWKGKKNPKHSESMKGHAPWNKGLKTKSL